MYLSSNFSVSGEVVEGNKLGSKIGFPTANISIENEWKILPKYGVYDVKIFFKDQLHCEITITATETNLKLSCTVELIPSAGC